MKTRLSYILFILTAFRFVVSCNNLEEDFVSDGVANEKIMSLQCVFEDSNWSCYSAGRISTKSLINQTSNTDELLCNFLRLDEKDGMIWDWKDSYLSEGKIATVPGTDNSRSVTLYPEQPYNTADQTAKKSRMIGWYPRIDNIPQTDEDDYANIKFSSFASTYIEKEGAVHMKFTGLDGSKDLMISDMKEGSIEDPFDTFSFKHYLSAIRVYAKAERSSQDIGMWGYIEEVVIKGQPTSCVVELPTTPSSLTGNKIEWGTENAKFKIQKNHIFGDNDTDYAQNQKAEEYPVKLEGSNVEKFLGYSLIRPEQDLQLQLHTSAGVYNIVVPWQFGEGTTKTPVFNAGYIYDIHLDFKTDGTVFAFIENDGDEKYFDLSTGYEYDSGQEQTYEYKNANCYIISSDTDYYKTEGAQAYDGFCFDATVVGNGEAGILSAGAQTFYPQNAHIEPYSAEVLWQTSTRLISQIDLLYGHVRFKVAKEGDKYKEGNAVIAVYDKNKKILWSWHIWITDMPQDLSYTEGGTTITIMDRNLGAVSHEIPYTSEAALETYGLYYQWGRKDPSMGPPAYDYSPINMTTAPYYDYSSEKKDAAEVVRLAQPTLKDAVENPMYLLMPTTLTQTYYFNWLYEKIDFLWGYSKENGTTHKTIYDPCPYGYRVSGGELADLFTYASTQSGNIRTDNQYGQIVTVPNGNQTQTFFFPYSGYKGVDRGLNSLISSWKYVGQKGDYQSSVVSMYTGDNEYYMHRSRIYLSKERTWTEMNVGSYTGHMIQDHTNRRTAAPVRCVKNGEQYNRLIAFITPDKTTITGETDKVKFNLYAYSFGSNIESATLSIGYHLKGSEDVHKESVIESWTSGDSPKEWNIVYEYDFANFENLASGLNFDDATGEFRFILRVKSADNINRMSSTTITIQKNYVEFLNWADEELLFTGTDIDKRFRIYGDSQPTGVTAFWKKEDDTVSDPIILTGNLQVNQSSTYQYDYTCTTSGLKFDTPGNYYVYLLITLNNGQVIETEPKKIIIEHKEQSSLTEVTSLDDIDNNGIYVIMNVFSDDFVYDAPVGDPYIYADAVLNDYSYFKIITKNNQYYIKNVKTGHYANVYNTYTLQMDKASENDATKFDLLYDNTGKYFTIRTKPKSSYQYWQQAQGNTRLNITSNAVNPDYIHWKIYKQKQVQ